MKVPLRWLTEFVDTGLAPRDLAHRLTMAGLEAEKIETVGEEWANVFVGAVERVERHPNADRLLLADVIAGPHRLRVVTGAPNVAQGQKVALALAGARLIDGHSDEKVYRTLKPGKIRGIESEGMVCSEKELGLSDEHEGIMVLPADAPVGTPLVDYLGDTVIEFEITPNRVDAFSVLGIAREAAALTRRKVTLPPAYDLANAPSGADDLVIIEDTDLCPRYSAVVIDGVRVEPSPPWLQRRLAAAGVRPINNVVDVTNYVMLEWGQPLHAFDRDRLHEGRIVVRRARSGETIETLDHVVRELTIDMLVIADADRSVAVAGVIGGVDSEVSDGTTSVLLETANFAMKSVRHTARALRLRTEASARFERGIDPNLVWDAASRATRLLLDLCPGARVTAVGDVYPSPLEPWAVTLPFGRIERVLGVGYEPAIVLDALDRLTFRPVLTDTPDGELLTLTVPTYRPDVTIPEDVVEEVARVIGYESLPETLPADRVPPVKRDPMLLLQREARELLVGIGFAESVTYITLSERILDDFQGNQEADPEVAGSCGFLHTTPVAELLRIRNPLQSGRDLLRPTLLPSLLEIAEQNLKHERAVRLVELARVYLPRGRDVLPHEANVAGLVVAGARDPFGRYAQAGVLDFFDLKGDLEALLQRLGLRDVAYAPAGHPALHPGRAAEATVKGERVALLGELRPDVAEAFGVEGVRVAVAEVDLDRTLASLSASEAQVRVPRFLPVEQDFAVVVEESVPAGEVELALLAGAGPLATGIVLFDVFRGPQLGEGKKSLAYRLTFTAPDRALTDDDLVKVRPKIERTVAQRVGGTLRA
jgi:phenylalanyl-tRNA synthetase beta chain